MKDLNDPSNRDTIPAMLTAGEFVMNKEATAMFGPQIEKMNNAGLAQRQAENEVFGGHNMGGVIQHNQYNAGGLVTFLKDKEGWKDKAYQDDAGVWTIGYGRTGDVKKGDTTTKAIEDPWLDTRAAEELAAVKAFGKKHNYEWNDGQMNALASFRYNGGQGMIDQLTADGTRDNDTIQKKFGLYNKVTDPNTGKKVFVEGLQNRRDAELGLWGGTTPTETPEVQPLNAAPETMQEITAPVESPAEDLVGMAAQQAFAPPPQMQAPPMMQQPGAAPEYIPSVTQGNLPTSTPQMPTEESNPMNNNSLWNSGGPVYLNRGGRGQEKVWDSATQKYIWVDPSDIRVEQEKALAASAPVRNNQMKPMAFAQAAQPNVTHMGPRQTRAPHQSPFVSPDNSLMQFDRSPDDIGDEIQRGWNKEDFDMGAQSQPGTVPQIGSAFQAGPQPPQMPGNMAPPPPAQQDLPPVPGSDEALLQGSSQQVETAEQQQSVPQVDQSPPRHTPNVDALRGEHRAMNEGRRDHYDPRDPRNRLPGEGVHTPDPRLAEPGAGYGGNAGVPGLEVEPPKTGGGRGSWHDAREELLSTLPDVTLPQTERQSTALEGRYQHAVDQAQEDLDGAIEKGDAKAITKASNDLATSQGRLTEQEEEVARSESAAKYAEEAARFAEIRRQNAASDEKLVALNEAKKNVTDPAVQAQIDAQITALEEGKVEEVAPDPVAQTEVVQAGAGPKGRGKGADKARDIAAATVAAKSKIKDLEAAEGETLPAGSTSTNDAKVAGTNIANNEPGKLQEAGNALKDAFTGLFDSKSLARAAIMMLGAMATGMSPGQALAFAGKDLLVRSDQAEQARVSSAATKQKRFDAYMKTGDWTSESVKAALDSNFETPLVPVGVPITESGKTATYFDKNTGRQIDAVQMDAGGKKFWVDPATGKPFSLASVHQNADQVKGTGAYTKRVQGEGKTYTGVLDSVREQHGIVGVGKDGKTKIYATNINPEVAGLDIAEFGIANNVLPEEMGRFIDIAYRDAAGYAQASKIKPSSLKPFLNDAFITARVGDKTLFEGSDAINVSKVMDQWKGALIQADPEKFQNMNATTLSTMVIQKARPAWTNLKEDNPEAYQGWVKKAKAMKGHSPFELWLSAEIGNGIQGGL